MASECATPNNLSFRECSCQLGVERKNFIPSFVKNFIEETRLFWKIFLFPHSHISISSLFSLVVNFRDIAALGWHFPNTGWLLLDFSNEKFLCKLNFVWRIITLNHRCYLLVVLCLESPEFVQYSLAMHKRVISGVNKSLGTFVRHALSTLVSTFLRTERSFFGRRHVKLVPFFPVRDNPVCFDSLTSSFSAPVGQIHPLFAQNKNGIPIYHTLKFRPPRVFSVSY